jgi:hypothetical protein
MEEIFENELDIFQNVCWPAQNKIISGLKEGLARRLNEIFPAGLKTGRDNPAAVVRGDCWRWRISGSKHRLPSCVQT